MLTPPAVSLSVLREQIRELGRRDEGECVAALLDAGGVPDGLREGVEEHAAALVHAIRERQHYGAHINALLNEYSLTSNEGVLLMCLAEALLRVPDKATTDRLITDKLGGGDWGAHLGRSHSLFVNASAWGLLLTGKVIAFQAPGGDVPHQRTRRLAGRVGEPAIRAAMRLAMRIMGTQFVLGTDIGEALDRSATWQARGYRYTYDMLGESARTGDYARDYFQGYCSAIEQVGRQAGSESPVTGPGFSIKLSALHPRYELARFSRLRDELAPRLLDLATLARRHSLGLTIDAEEAHRLDPMLELFEQVFSDPALRGWEGLGIAVQAYLKNAPAVIDWVTDLARRQGRKIMVRLVKGAYWDAEIKLAQTLGYAHYPVYTRKASSDLAYLVGARRLLAARELVYPQFATHNAHSVAAILKLAGDTRGYEFQRLHGMGEELFDELIDGRETPVDCRIYAPVGVHKDLLAYLVRRLLENGANSSFVHKIADEEIPDRELVADPARKLRNLVHLANPGIPLPPAIYGPGRVAAAGIDLDDVGALQRMAADLGAWRQQIGAVGCDAALPGALAVRNPADSGELLGHYQPSTQGEMDERLELAVGAFAAWSARPAADRAALIRGAADLLESHCHELVGFCVREAGKTLRDSIADVREAIDFCRYYADQAGSLFERDGGAATPRGVMLCISPWNFPVAIFVGQLSAALVTGNTVLAKPAEQTTLTALRVLQLFHRAGVPADVLQALLGPGAPIGARLLPDSRIAGVMFTGSTEVARYLARTLADRDGERVPLIAETGGQNAMVVDSTALLEKVVDDVIASGFNSAGQRCSALRVLLVQEDVAGPLAEMLVGAMRELQLGDPADLATDVGPIIDGEALARLQAHVDYLSGNGRLLYRCALPDTAERGHFFAPALYELDRIDLLPQEVFGPVVHLVRYRAEELDSLPAMINSTGYGLTFGVHSRIESTIDALGAGVGAGNVYVNRNIIGAVVGVQPFGGRGLSGTGPKAGGPYYLQRLVTCPPRAVSATDPAAPLPTGGLPLAGREWRDRLAAVAAAFEEWHVLPTAHRLACVGRLRDMLAARDRGSRDRPVDAIADLLAQGERVAEPLELQGPTGESNTLLLEGRGVIVCLHPGADPDQDLLVSACAAALAGNAVLVASPGSPAPGDAVAELMAAAGFPAGLVASLGQVNLATLDVLLREGSIAGVVAPHGSLLAPPASRALARRQGAILPLIDDPFGPGYLVRFCYEKTLTVNTTAGGGNAALMSQGDAD